MGLTINHSIQPCAKFVSTSQNDLAKGVDCQPLFQPHKWSATLNRRRFGRPSKYRATSIRQRATIRCHQYQRPRQGPFPIPSTLRVRSYQGRSRSRSNIVTDEHRCRYLSRRGFQRYHLGLQLEHGHSHATTPPLALTTTPILTTRIAPSTTTKHLPSDITTATGTPRGGDVRLAWAGSSMQGRVVFGHNVHE